VLLVPLARIGDDYLLSREKLCPVLGYHAAASVEQALTAAQAMVRRQGKGHSAAIHARNPQIVFAYGSALNVLRVVVNVGNSTGAAGFDTFLAPTMTVGTGFFGRSSISENVGPQHLVQWVKIAYNKSGDVPFGDFSTAIAATTPHTRPRLPEGAIDYSFDWVGGRPSASAESRQPRAGEPAKDIREVIRQIVLEELRELQLEER
jgi:hypothetical protein